MKELKQFLLPIFNIRVFIIGESGTISSDLHEDNEDQYNLAIDGIEALILAHAVAGIDIESKEYLEGIKTAVEGCAANID